MSRVKISYSFEGDLNELITTVTDSVSRLLDHIDRLDIERPDRHCAIDEAPLDPTVPLAAPGLDMFAVPTMPAVPTTPNSQTSDVPLVSTLDWATIPLSEEAGRIFVQFIKDWCVGFEQTGQPQPNRVQMMKDLGQGRWTVPVLRWIKEYNTLQKAVLQAMFLLGEIESDPSKNAPPDDKVELAARVSAHIVQIAHAGFQDVVDLFDYSTRWRRSL